MLVIIVDVRADKAEIKAAVQDILGVKVEKVNTLIRYLATNLLMYAPELVNSCVFSFCLLSLCGF